MTHEFDENDDIQRKRGVAMNLAYRGVPTADYDNDRHEKPWQRVIEGMTRKGKHLYEPVVSVPNFLILVLLGWYMLLAFCSQLIEDGMPRVINESDLARDDTNAFSEESAWKHLRNILGDQPRVAGTAYHYNKTRDMKEMVDTIASEAIQTIRTDWQIVSGDFTRSNSSTFISQYVNVSNIIAVLEGESGFNSDGTTGTSVLFNCHYDSVPFAMGASDNAIFCAVLMEILSKFSKRTQKFKNNIVFLFNGAEESGLLGSHGFLKHPWAKGVTSVVNLDSAGINGKPSVFQVSDGRVLGAYGRGPGASAQGVGEFLFSSGIIPSDTDFRIFRDYGGINGIDIAFTRGGLVYHTRYDHLDLVQPGVVQNAGNTIMALMHRLGDMDELRHKVEPSVTIYYDYFNGFMLIYSPAIAYAVDVAILLCAITSIGYYVWLVGPRWSTVSELLLSALGRAGTAGAGLVAGLLPVPIVVATTTQLRYLSHPLIVVPLFWLPYMVGAVGASHAYDRWRTKKSGLNRSIRSLQAMTATRLCLALVLLALMCVSSLRSTRYLLSVPLLILSVTSLLSITVVRYLRLTAWQHLVLEVVLSTPAVMFVFLLTLRLVSMLLPIMGRSPTDSPDYLVGIVNVGMAVVLAATVSGIELLFSRRRLWLVLSLTYVACVIVMFIPMSPYQDEGPATQRHYWFHSDIVRYNAEGAVTERSAGLLAVKMDAYTISSVVSALPGYSSSRSHRCDDRVYCGLPLFRTSFAANLDKAVFIDMDGPAPFSPAVSLTSSKTCAGENCTYNFVIQSGHADTLTLWPRQNVTVLSWSLDSPVGSTFQLLDRPVYTVIYTFGTLQGSIAPYEFNVTCHVPLSLQPHWALEVSLHAHRTHHPEDFTPQYRSLLLSAPRYFNVASFLSFRRDYEV